MDKTDNYEKISDTIIGKPFTQGKYSRKSILTGNTDV